MVVGDLLRLLCTVGIVSAAWRSNSRDFNILPDLLFHKDSHGSPADYQGYWVEISTIKYDSKCCPESGYIACPAQPCPDVKAGKAWIAPYSSEVIPWQLDIFPLEIKTPTAVKDAKVWIIFYVAGSNDRLHLKWRSADWKISMSGCTGYSNDSLDNVKKTHAIERIWRIEKNAEGLKIYCKQVLVYSKKFADCSLQSIDWSRAITSMEFKSGSSKADIATPYYTNFLL